MFVLCTDRLSTGVVCGHDSIESWGSVRYKEHFVHPPAVLIGYLTWIKLFCPREIASQKSSQGFGVPLSLPSDSPVLHSQWRDTSLLPDQFVLSCKLLWSLSCCLPWQWQWQLARWLKQIWDQARETRWQPQCSTPSRDISKVSSLSFSPPIDNFPHSTHHCFNITPTGPAPKFWLIMAHSTSWSVSLKNVLSSTYNLMNRCINIASLVDSFGKREDTRSVHVQLCLEIKQEREKCKQCDMFSIISTYRLIWVKHWRWVQVNDSCSTSTPLLWAVQK